MNKLAYLLLAAALLGLAASGRADEEPSKSVDKEPPFPLFTDPNSVSLSRLHIRSESVSDIAGYQTFEEYTDFIEGKSAVMDTDKSGTRVILLDAQANLVYEYEPFNCQILLDPLDLKKFGLSDLWTRTVKVQDKSSENAESSKQMRLYGVSALWLNAAQLEKTYSREEFVFSVRRSIQKLAHKWTITDTGAKQYLHLYFLIDSDKTASLEMIQIQSIESKAVLASVNILAVDYLIPSEIYDSIMQVPVGFGCACSQASNMAAVKFPELSSIYLSGPLLSHSHRLELEVTATKYPKGGDHDTLSAVSDTVNVDMVHTNLGSRLSGIFQLIRQRSYDTNIKTIVDHALKVKQVIDLRTGSCEMTNMLGVTIEDGLFRDEVDALTIKFSNGLELDLTPKAVQSLFTDLNDFHYIKTVQEREGAPSFLYFEQADSDLIANKDARIVRVYSSINQQIALETVTVWVFDENKQHLQESYHLNIVDALDLEDKLPELAKLFDVTEECYFNNENMKVNRDYAWLEVFYPLTSIQSNILSTMEYTIKSSIYSHFLLRSSISPIRIPRIELMFEETGLIARLLLLDMPSIELTYNLIVGSTFQADQEKGELEELAVDLRHCADYCRLHFCISMSFCETDHSCMISQLSYASSGDSKTPLTRNSRCQTFVMPGAEYGLRADTMMSASLHKIVSDLQHIDYQTIEVPKLPDELIYPTSETGIDQKKRIEISQIYRTQMLKFIMEQFDSVSALVMLFASADYPAMVLVPNRVQLEEDPLEQFGLAGDKAADQEDSSGLNMGLTMQTSTSAFREGVNFKRFKVSTLVESATTDDGSKPRNLVQAYFGLSYDQCALACIDGKCSSFSYCKHREECVITNIYNLAALDDSALEKDLGCFIVQRDFVSKFNKFPDVYRPQTYKVAEPAVNPSECAHSCMSRTDFNCLAFDYCPSQDLDKPTCYFLDQRGVPAKRIADKRPTATTTTEISTTDSRRNSQKLKPKTAGCDHYSRSYLADFVRIEYREIEKSLMNELKTNQYVGQSVDVCAELCAIELTDCSAFQFCLDPDQGHKSMQTCEMIQSKPEGVPAPDLEAIIGRDGRVVRAGKLFSTNQNCHVFSLRPDSSEAHLRDLALSSLTTKELEERESKKERNNSAGLSLFGAILLYLSMTLIFAAVGCGVLLAKQHNSFVAAKIERIRLLLGHRL